MNCSVVVAILTPPGSAALATLAIAGESAVPFSLEMFRPAIGRTIAADDFGPHYGLFAEDPADDVVWCRRPAAGLPVVEIHCHGGRAMVDGLLAQIIARGASLVPWQTLERMAGATEVQVEAWESLAQSASPKGARILMDQAAGSLDRAFEQMEKHRNFEVARSLLAWADLGLHLCTPWRVVLLGPPNVGKSRLLNAILGFDRAIVHPSAGTTRDVIDVDTNIDGWPVRWIDGAGLRETHDAIEQEGIERIKSQSASADLCLCVADLSREETLFRGDSLFKEDNLALTEAGGSRRPLWIGNKCDLPSPWDDAARERLDHRVSAATGEGIDLLLQHVMETLIPKYPAPGTAIPFTRRQIDFVESFLRTHSEPINA